MICGKKLEIIARRGEYSLLDKECGSLSDTTLFQLPTDMGKGILVAPTTHGNILVGPTAHDTRDKWNVDTTEECQNELFVKGSMSVPALDRDFSLRRGDGGGETQKSGGKSALRKNRVPLRVGYGGRNS